jgi:hypothetical protein
MLYGAHTRVGGGEEEGAERVMVTGRMAEHVRYLQPDVLRLLAAQDLGRLFSQQLQPAG